jgi:hypothetical protein
MSGHFYSWKIRERRGDDLFVVTKSFLKSDWVEFLGQKVLRFFFPQKQNSGQAQTKTRAGFAMYLLVRPVLTVRNLLENFAEIL